MPLHEYQRDPYSNAGNCVCGMDYESRSHPHPYTQAYRSNTCVCAHPASHPIHTDGDTAEPDPAYPEPGRTLRGTEAAREAVRQARGHDAAPQTPITFARPDYAPEGGAS